LEFRRVLFRSPLVVLFMVGVITVREVQAGDIHAVLNQSEDPIRAGDRRTEGAYNFSSSFHIDQPNPSRLRRRQWLRESHALFTCPTPGSGTPAPCQSSPIMPEHNVI